MEIWAQKGVLSAVYMQGCGSDLVWNCQGIESRKERAFLQVEKAKRFPEHDPHEEHSAAAWMLKEKGPRSCPWIYNQK